MRVATELVRQATQLQEKEQASRRVDQLMNQADQRAKDAEDKVSVAVTAIGSVKTPEQRKIKLNNRDADKFWLETCTANRVDKKSFAEFFGEVETYLSVLAVRGACTLCTLCAEEAQVKLKAVSKTDGFNTGRVLAMCFQDRSTSDSMSLLTMIMNLERVKDFSDMMNTLDRWDAV